MNIVAVMKKINLCFSDTPKNDNRAKIQPFEFVVNLLFCFIHSGKNRSIADLRRQMINLTHVTISRSTFWERLATERLNKYLSTLVAQFINQLKTQLKISKNTLAELGITGIYLLDSSSISLLKGLAKDYPGPRNNVAPAVIKWHLLFDLVNGIPKWFITTPGKTHDRKGFPPLQLLKGALIILDLGYYDYKLFQSISQVGGFYLSRIKSNAIITIKEVKIGLKKTKFEGKDLLKSKLPKRKSIVEVFGAFHYAKKEVLTARVIGFWNPLDKCYHWYVTNLQVPAYFIYPLYRLRWQIELVFKLAKRSLCLSDMPSGNKVITENLVLLAIAGITMITPIVKVMALGLAEEKQTAISFQRAGMIFSYLGKEIRDYLLYSSIEALNKLIEKLQLFLGEMIDPNYKHRQTSMERIRRVIVDGQNKNSISDKIQTYIDSFMKSFWQRLKVAA